MGGYIFAHFTDEAAGGEQVFFSISRDGLHWCDLHNGAPALVSSIGECGVRDPFLVRHPVTGIFYLMATDLCMKARKNDWEGAVKRGSRDIIIWESTDLVAWSAPRAATVAPQGAGCAWAPEAIWDANAQAFFVFFAAYTHENEASKHRIYAVHTKDFVNFTTAVKYIEREQSIIDTTIILDHGVYYRFSKDEASASIKVDQSADLHGVFEPVSFPCLDGLKGLEGPECYRLPNGQWCLICDQYAARKGYLPIVIDDLEAGAAHVLEETAYSLGASMKRHGGVLWVDDEDAIFERIANSIDGGSLLAVGDEGI